MPNYNNYYDARTIHLRLKVNGSAEKRAFFHFVATKLDSDWPHPPEGIGKHGANGAQYCTECNGWEYRAPGLDKDKILALARQVDAVKEIQGHLKVKVKRYEKTIECMKTGGGPPIPLYPAEWEGMD